MIIYWTFPSGPAFEDLQRGNSEELSADVMRSSEAARVNDVYEHTVITIKHVTGLNRYNYSKLSLNFS